MRAARARRGFTFVELIVVTIILVIAIALLIPAVNAARESERRSQCINNLKQIGLGIQNYASVNGVLPPSASVFSQGPGGARKVGGWSFLVKILPYGPHKALYKSLTKTADPEDMTNAATAAAMNTLIPEYICPSNPNPHFQNPRANPSTMALTNYKGSGATSRDSLKMAVDVSLPPPYGPATMHPDGTMFPGNKGLRFADIPDGTTMTFVTIETMDDTWSRWTVGREVALVGLPQKGSPTGSKPPNNLTYFVTPPSDQPKTDNEEYHSAVPSFLSYDFSPRGADAETYEDPGFASRPPAYGPSSGHPRVICCGFVDGSVQAIFKKVDAFVVFYSITKNNGDPYPLVD